jgi:hypothetical protein
MAWEATLFTNWRCAGGIPLADLGIVGSESLLIEQLDRQSGVTLSLDADYYDVCRERLVVFLTAEDGKWWEFRISGVRRDRTRSGFTLEGKPPWFDLEGSDLVREYLGSRCLFDFDETRTPAEFIAGRFLANLERDGLGWIGAGACDFTQPLPLKWSRLDRAAFANLLPNTL